MVVVDEVEQTTGRATLTQLLAQQILVAEAEALEITLVVIKAVMVALALLLFHLLWRLPQLQALRP
jgi:hypothetical protein